LDRIIDFGSIPTRALTYMRDLEQEMYVARIPVKHVIMGSSNRFELAPILKKQTSGDLNCLLDVVEKNS
jgi:glutamine synthetase